MSTYGEPFFAKILLLGEYSLIYGSGALSMPFREKYVQLLFPTPQLSENETRTAHNSNQQLKTYSDFLIAHKNKTGVMLDLEKMQDDIDRGLYLKSNIPSGYGLGSSGALVAALFYQYTHKNEKHGQQPDVSELENLKRFFSFMESFFHGSSSGIDPLSSFLKKPLLVDKHQKLAVADIKLSTTSNKGGFFLIDTGKSRKTAPLVQLFKEKYKTTAFRKILHSAYIPMCNECIEALLTGNNAFHGMLHQLSDLQLRYFKEMIPADFRDPWVKGLSSGLYTIKLCGAGGGGYLLGYTENHDKAMQAFQYLCNLKRFIKLV